MSYDFTIYSPQGDYEQQYSSLEEFFKCWGHDLDFDFSTGEMLTFDCSKTIVPQNEFTLTSMLEHQKLKFKSNFDDYLHGEVLSFENMALDKVTANMLSSDTAGPINHPYGNLFVINNATENGIKIMQMLKPNSSLLNSLNMDEGSMYLKDTLVVEDGYNNQSYLFDLRGEALSVNDVLSRSVEKGETINTWIEPDDTITDKYIENDTLHIFGRDDAIKKIKTKLITLDPIELNISFNGFNNSLITQSLIEPT